MSSPTTLADRVGLRPACSVGRKHPRPESSAVTPDTHYSPTTGTTWAVSSFFYVCFSSWHNYTTSGAVMRHYGS